MYLWIDFLSSRSRVVKLGYWGARLGKPWPCRWEDDRTFAGNVRANEVDVRTSGA